MTSQTRKQGAYAEELRRLVRALTAVKEEGAPDVQTEEPSPLQVKLFAEENLEKRCEKLQRHLEFLADAFDGLPGLLWAYGREMPLAAYDNVASDAEQFLHWLEHGRPLTPEQRDFVACQRARHAVETLARGNRPGYVRFQELWSVAGRLAGELATNPGLSVHLNPIRVWSRLNTRALLDDELSPPVEVLFFAAGGDTRTAVLDAGGQACVRELTTRGPCTLDAWAALSEHADRGELVSLCHDLAQMGLVAFS